MAPRGGTDLKFTPCGLEHHSDGEVFAAKLKKLISGLKRLDRDYNEPCPKVGDGLIRRLVEVA